jgi:DNA (cytosine-5)-methyltransferase 1
MKHLGLFEGIGGFSLAARWAGWDTVAWCEWNEFGQKVLRHHFPEAEGHGDITKTDFKIYANKIDIITGGFPCQPYSLAGKRKGKEDERHLWPEMLRAIREIQPRWVVGENVLGLVNWNGGLVFNEVQADLEAAGYEVWPYVLPACAVNAPHRRDRIWFVAYNQHNGNRRREQQQKSEQETNTTSENTGSNGCSNGKYDKQISKRNEWEFGTGSKKRIFVGEALQNDTNTDCDGCDQCNGNDEINAGEGGFNALGNADTGNEYGDAADTADKGRKEWEQTGGRQNETEIRSRMEFRTERFCNDGDVADTGHTRLQGSQVNGSIGGSRTESDKLTSRCVCSNWQNFPTQSPICSRNDGLSTKLDGITFSKWRNESIKAAGNAIVPQVAYEIFKAINQYEISQHTHTRKP